MTATSQPAAVRHLCQKKLADRWGLSERTLERYRLQGLGPVFLKINGRVLYRLEDVEAFEAERLHASTSALIPTGPRTSP